MSTIFSRLGAYNRAIQDQLKGYRRLFALNIVLGFISGLLGSVGITAIIPLFYIISNEENPALDGVTEIITSFFSFLHIPLKPSLLLAFIILLFLAKAIVTFVAKWISEKMSAHYTESVRKQIFKKSLHASWGYLLNQKTSTVERTIMDDTEKSGQIMTEITNIILALTSIITYGVVAFSVSPMAALLTLPAGALLFIFFKRFFAIVRKLVETVIKIDRKTTHYILEHLSGIKTVKTAGAEEPVIKNAWHYFEELTNIRIKFVTYDQITALSFEPLSVIIVACLFFISYHAPGFNIAAFAATIYLVQKIFSFIQIFQSRIQILNKIVPNLATVKDLLKMLDQNAESKTGSKAFVFDKSLSFDHVTLCYEEGKPVLDDVSFSITKGSCAGLIGRSGAGKTSVADVILRLFHPNEGQVMLDGTKAEEISLSYWRKNIVYVTQDAFLLNNTISENIRFYDDEITDEDIVEAAKRANIFETIMRLPNQFATNVGERGVKLSGGQKQRVALARALARKPSLLILDEATSALDNESEQYIQETLNSIRGSVTILLIAHRFSTVTNTDHIITLENGKLIEQGDPQKLLENPDSYFARMRSL